MAWLRTLSVQAEADNQTMMIGHDWSGELGERERVFLTARVALLRTGTETPASQGFVFLINDLTEVVRLEEARRVEARRRQQIRNLFGRYLAPRVVEHLLANPDDVQLGGVRQEVTILFVDLRGFTTLSEQREPEDVVRILNRFLALATREIFAELGTIDKFVGDGVMAVFNAPVELPDHEAAAVRAGLRMQRQLRRMVEDAEGELPIGCGIGINTGPAIVGNIGTSELMNYTAIGDAVNVSARLQAEAQLGEVLISDATYARVRDHFAVEELGPRQVKGRSRPVLVYRVVGTNPRSE
jgi:adenylate cyclase